MWLCEVILRFLFCFFNHINQCECFLTTANTCDSHVVDSVYFEIWDCGICRFWGLGFGHAELWNEGHTDLGD